MSTPGEHCRHMTILLCAVLLPLYCQAAEPNSSNFEKPTQNVRKPSSESELAYWLRNMFWDHGFTAEEAAHATGLSIEEVDRLRRQRRLFATTRPPRTPGGPLRVLPYPGGRHPRIGFLEGAIDPQRETKFSVFAPWDDTAYVVVDSPEAIWSNLGLTYLAHTHVPTIWSKQDIELQPLEWQRLSDGKLQIERQLPNGITFGASVLPHSDHVEMHLWLHNGTDMPLTDLRVQNCAMLKRMPGMTAQTNANKVFQDPYVACRGPGGRWVILAWEHCFHPWGNASCPCLHSDPKLPDCAPGQTVHANGWLSFFEGPDLQAELSRIDALGWKDRPFTPPEIASDAK